MLLSRHWEKIGCAWMWEEGCGEQLELGWGWALAGQGQPWAQRWGRLGPEAPHRQRGVRAQPAGHAPSQVNSSLPSASEFLRGWSPGSSRSSHSTASLTLLSRRPHIWLLSRIREAVLNDRVQFCSCWRFPNSSVGKETACNAGDPSSIPGLGRSTGEGIGYPLQYSWASLVAQLVKNPPAIQETWVWSLGWKDSLGEGKGYLLQCSDVENPMDCIVYGVTKSQTRLSDFHFICNSKIKSLLENIFPYF